jgi:hypothetical protein
MDLRLSEIEQSLAVQVFDLLRTQGLVTAKNLRCHGRRCGAKLAVNLGTTKAEVLGALEKTLSAPSDGLRQALDLSIMSAENGSLSVGFIFADHGTSLAFRRDLIRDFGA